MFHSRKANNKINRLHERALRLIYNDYNSSFDQLLEKDGSVSIHHRNIHSLSVQMYKIYHGSDKSNPLHDMISVRSDRTLRSDFPIPAVRSENNGENSIRYLGPLIWKIIPPLIKQADNLYDFKKRYKKVETYRVSLQVMQNVHTESRIYKYNRYSVIMFVLSV